MKNKLSIHYNYFSSYIIKHKKTIYKMEYYEGVFGFIIIITIGPIVFGFLTLRYFFEYCANYFLLFLDFILKKISWFPLRFLIYQLKRLIKFVFIKLFYNTCLFFSLVFDPKIIKTKQRLYIAILLLPVDLLLLGITLIKISIKQIFYFCLAIIKISIYILIGLIKNIYYSGKLCYTLYKRKEYRMIFYILSKIYYFIILLQIRERKITIPYKWRKGKFNRKLAKLQKPLFRKKSVGVTYGHEKSINSHGSNRLKKSLTTMGDFLGPRFLNLMTYLHQKIVEADLPTKLKEVLIILGNFLGSKFLNFGAYCKKKCKHGFSKGI